MATKRSKAAPRSSSALARDDVESFLASLNHPHKDAIVRLRALLRGADPLVTEGVKWNAPSFAVGEHFATFHLRKGEGVMIVMHFGAKKGTSPKSRPPIDDPGGLLTWRGNDRATITFADLDDVETKREAFIAVVRSWIAALRR